METISLPPRSYTLPFLSTNFKNPLSTLNEPLLFTVIFVAAIGFILGCKSNYDKRITKYFFPDRFLVPAVQGRRLTILISAVF